MRGTIRTIGRVRLRTGGCDPEAFQEGAIVIQHRNSGLRWIPAANRHDG